MLQAGFAWGDTGNQPKNSDLTDILTDHAFQIVHRVNWCLALPCGAQVSRLGQFTPVLENCDSAANSSP